MTFDPDAVDRLTPEQRVEVQEWIVARWWQLRAIVQPERRRMMRLRRRKRDWPQPWQRNTDPVSADLRRMTGATRG